MALTRIDGSVLANTGVSSGSYGSTTQISTFVVGIDGRITAASNVTPSVANTQITGTITSSQLSTTTVAAGTYGGSTSIPVITINAQGQVTSASNTVITGDLYDFDDISNSVDGFQNTFKLSYNGNQITVLSPNLILVTVNGLKQPNFVAKYDTVWLANVLTASKGYTIDTSGNPTTNNYIKFADSPPAGSQIEIQTLFGSTPSNPKIYPFKPLDIIMGF
jgi:hypothetical protein